jgi:hypothetical protein
MRAIALAPTLFAFAAAPALADTMHPVFGAKLAGMGEHGIVNFHSYSAQKKLCWTFDLASKGITGASIRDGHGMIVARLGSSFRAKSCASVAQKALQLLETKPRSYFVWVDTKGHPGDLRGALLAGMAHM